MKKLFLLCLLSFSALADENDANARYCGGVVEKKPNSCAAKYCKEGLLCDFNCAEQNEDNPSAFKKCRDSCWEKAIKKMSEKCG